MAPGNDPGSPLAMISLQMEHISMIIALIIKGQLQPQII